MGQIYNYICLNCQTGFQSINYDKRDCKPTNLITSCVSCNSRANSNKEYWEGLYSGLVNG